MPADGSAPIFVVGYQRSGTTLLQALIGAHSRIAAPPEAYFFFRVADHAEYFGDLADDENLARALHEALHPPVDIFADAAFDEEVLLDRAKRSPRTYRALFDTILSDFAERHGKPRWSEKSPGQPIGAFLPHFPDAQVIHIVRDPRDVVASSLGLPQEAPDARATARDWRVFTLRTIRRGLEIGPAQYLQVRYEDLARDPAAVLRIVCAFVGEAFEPAMVNDPSLRQGTVADAASPWQERALAAVAPADEGRWRDRLGSRDQRRVHAVVGPMLAPLGYAQPGARAKVAAAPLQIREATHRLRGPLRRRARPLSPAARYELARNFLKEQARRVGAAL